MIDEIYSKLCYTIVSVMPLKLTGLEQIITTATGVLGRELKY